MTLLADIRFLARHAAGDAPVRPIRRIGMPRALLHYRFGTLAKTFLEILGFDVVVSPPSDARILARGDAISIDECCLPSKLYLGHALSLIEGDDPVDALFVPSFGSANPREGFCTKFQSLPDMVANTLRGQAVAIVTVFVDNASRPRELRRSFLALGEALGARPDHSREAYQLAVRAQQEERRSARLAQERRLADLKARRDDTLTILLAAHPYIAHDPYLAGPIISSLEELGVVVLDADAVDRAAALKRSYGFSSTLPWVINRELIGAMLLLEPVIDGIVLVSAFSCGPDSMTDDVILRCFERRPILNLVVDATSGVAGLQTRIESFVDILRFAQKGGYHRDVARAHS